MSNRKIARLVLLVVLVVIVASLPVLGQGRTIPIKSWLSNFDVWNRGSQTANDFEVNLPGVTPGQITSLYRGSYPNTQTTPIGNGTQVRWTGSSTSPGQVAHFGVRLMGNYDPTDMTYYWTYNGMTLPVTPPRTGQRWVPGVGWVRDVIRNSWGQRVQVQRRVRFLPRSVMLDELMWNGDIWNQSTPIDTGPVWLNDGDELSYDFSDMGDGSYIMSYMVRNEQSQEVAVFMNAIDTVPEPSSLLTLALGVPAVFALRRRRR